MGSVLDGRRLNHHSGYSTRSPSMCEMSGAPACAASTARSRAFASRDPPVDLAGGVVAPEGCHQLGERLALGRENVEQGDEGSAAVVRHEGVREPEVEMSRELASEDGAALAHGGLHEGVADTAHLGDTACRLDRLPRGAARPEVVEDAAARAGAAGGVLRGAPS